jgi:hypothetical protein
MAELTGRRAAIPRARAARCTCSRREELLRRPRHRRRAGAAGHGPGLRQQVSRQRQRAWPISATAPPTRARSTRASTWRAVEAAGDLRHREQPVRHGHAVEALLGADGLLQARRAFGIPGEQVDGMDVLRRARRRGRRPWRMVPRRQRPLHPGDADLPLSRPLDVRPGEVPHRRKSKMRRARPDRAGAQRLLRGLGHRGRPQEDRRDIRPSSTRRREFAQDSPEPDPSELWTDLRLVERKRRTMMPIQVLMPALSPTMEEGKLAKWLKKEGDTVKSGDVIAEIETDKATMEVEAVDEGTSARS